MRHSVPSHFNWSLILFKEQYVVWNITNKQTNRCAPKVCTLSFKWSCPTATFLRQKRGLMSVCLPSNVCLLAVPCRKHITYCISTFHECSTCSTYVLNFLNLYCPYSFIFLGQRNSDELPRMPSHLRPFLSGHTIIAVRTTERTQFYVSLSITTHQLLYVLGLIGPQSGPHSGRTKLYKTYF